MEAAALHIVTDDLSEFVWRSAFGSEIIAGAHEEIKRIVGEIIKEIP